ncbi:MAG: PolC-type DNA polymerase III [Candidatus Pelethousia sp.]|nr:PolC-type DNA polymerase III [Candidatus Pelethousia sp.]
MEAGLCQLFERNGAPGAKLLSAKLIKEEEKLLATVEVGSLLTMGRMEAIRRALCEAMGCAAEIDFCFCGAALAALKGKDRALLAILRQSFMDLCPTARPALAGSHWRFEGEREVVISVAPDRLELAPDPRALGDAANFYKAAYGLPLELRIEADASIEAPAPEKELASQVQASDVITKKSKVVLKRNDEKDGKGAVLYGKAIKRSAVIRQSEVTEDAGRVVISGELTNMELRPTKTGAHILSFAISDHTNTLPCKIFLKEGGQKLADGISAAAKNGEWLLVHGDYTMDEFLHRMCLHVRDVGTFRVPKREDKAAEKRVELHLHTKMSSMDGLTNVKEAIATAARWGHKAIAITDHGVVHAFPDAVSTADKLTKGGQEIKAILGVEGYLLPDCTLAERPEIYVALAVTSAPAFRLDDLFEVAAVRFSGSEVLEEMRLVVDCGAILPEALYSPDLTPETLAQGISVKDALAALLAFLGDACPVAFGPETLNQLRAHAERHGLNFPGRYADGKTMAHYLCREVKEPNLEAYLPCFGLGKQGCGALAKARALAALFGKLLPEMDGRCANKIPLFDPQEQMDTKAKRRTYHIILIAKNHAGLKNLYRLVSYAHLEHLRKVPRIPRSLLLFHREGIIAGTACEAGELFRAMLGDASEEQLESIAELYDFLEIQPVGNNAFLVRNERVPNEEGLRDLNRRIVALGDRLHKPVVATGDVHFLEPEHAVFRSIIMHARGFEDAEQQAPLYFKTTDEMLAEFAYLGPEKAREVVVDNPNAIADSCERLKPFLSEKSTYAPTFPGAEDELRNMAMNQAHAIYGDPLPEVVQKRLDKELGSIIGNGYASLYLMAQRLVQKSLSDGYLVGSRGSVGSSFVANMAGITEVNALQPHYVCPKCRFSDFEVDRTQYACGVDMPDRACPNCGEPLMKLGYEIPFETFLGFKGDKTPDIDLNFSGEYQPVAHKFTEIMFGEGHAFRAGTISGVKDKTVYGYVRAWCDENGTMPTKEEIDRLVAGCAGVKKTTGQHPGGIVIVPAENDIMEFTPIQYPADKTDVDIITTHFDFHAMDDRLVKLDILGHDDPTVLRMLQDLTGLDPKTIPLDDKETMRIFSSAEPLGCSLEELGCDVGSIAIPEFGTSFVRQMLMDTRPTTMEELVRIAGLSHGTDVWLGNAQDLVLSGTATLNDVICTRDDIMNYLILRGGEPAISFKTMENVRKGRGLTEDMEAAMRAIQTPEWFIDSCKKIKYMFPRAHAAAYVMMAFRVAYYKVHLPLAFYAVYFTVRADAFDIAAAQGGADAVLKNIKALKKKGNEIEQKEADLLLILEVVFEMNKRGIALLPVDLYKSMARKFRMEDGKIRPPFSAVAGVGGNAADAVAQAGEKGPYLSVEDFRSRSGANSAVVQSLRDLGVLDGLPETNQLTLF